MHIAHISYAAPLASFYFLIDRYLFLSCLIYEPYDLPRLTLLSLSFSHGDSDNCNYIVYVCTLTNTVLRLGEELTYYLAISFGWSLSAGD